MYLFDAVTESQERVNIDVSTNPFSQTILSSDSLSVNKTTIVHIKVTVMDKLGGFT